MSDLRSAFEAWMFETDRQDPGCYWSEEQEQLWAAYQAATERAAQIADGYAKRNFPWASENSDTYHAQADWAQLIAAAIRGTEGRG